MSAHFVEANLRVTYKEKRIPHPQNSHYCFAISHLLLLTLLPFPILDGSQIPLR